MEQVNRDELERAARRIMEMNSKAQSAVSRRKEIPTPEEETLGRHERETAPETPITQRAKIHSKNSIFDIINFKNMVGDSDRTLLAGLMLLLGGEMADEKLMLALLYIML